MFTSVTRCLAVVAGIAALIGCQSDGITRPDTVLSLAIGDATNSTPEYGKIKVCKSADSNVSGDFDFDRDPVGASTGTALANATIAPGECIIVAEDDGGAGMGSDITITETSAGLVSITGQRIDEIGGVDVISNSPFVNGGELFVNSFHGFTITFKNVVQIGNNGCSPGYWKNHKFPAGYSKTDTFASVFGNAVYGAKTLQQVLSTGGGGVTALGRQTVSAFFNAVVYSDFGYTPAEVISMFNDAVPGTSAEQNALKDLFEGLTDVKGRRCTNPTGKK
jgi:hypothetical protein